MMTSSPLLLFCSLGISADEFKNMLMAFKGIYATIEDLWKKVPLYSESARNWFLKPHQSRDKLIEFFFDLRVVNIT